MAAPSFALVPSPLVGEATLVPLRDALRERGFPADVFAGQLAATSPSWGEWAESIAVRLRDGGHSVVAGHSGAGPGLDLIASRAPGVTAVVYLDGTLLEPGERLLGGVPPEALDAAVRRGVMPNPWCGPELWEQVGIPHRDAVARAAESRELPLAWYEQQLPEAAPEVAHCYIAFVPNRFYESAVATARARGWPLRELPGQHFHFMLQPGQVADAILDALAEAGVAQ